MRLNNKWEKVNFNITTKEDSIMGKKINAIVKLQLPAGKATPGPPVGSSLGPHGINIAAFTKEFNDKPSAQAGLIIPVVITIYQDRSLKLHQQLFLLRTQLA